MHNLFRLVLGAGVFAVVLRAAELPRTFSQSLSAEQRQQLGLANLSPEQLARLDAAIADYNRGETALAVRQAEKNAATAAVANYKKQEEPGVIARTLDVFKRRQAEDNRERFTSRVVGEFRGWQGGTYFPLENGEVWRQVGTELNEIPPETNAAVEIYRSNSGYWRLKYGGAWITVKRLQ